MRVRCVATLPTAEHEKRLGRHYRAGRQGFGVVLQQEYVVFALKTLGGEPWIEISDPEASPGYLFGVPLCLFEVVNSRVSVYWEIGTSRGGELKIAPPSLFREYYHDDLFEGVASVVDDFTRLRAQLIAEDLAE
jgi:hypothetical protein